MPCAVAGHVPHEWPDEGTLDIDACEQFCAYCTGDARQKAWKDASNLRQHVKRSHARPGRSHPRVVVAIAIPSRLFNLVESHAPILVPPPSTPAPSPNTVALDTSMRVLRVTLDQLHLRAHVLRNFQLLVWHHLLRYDIPDLQDMAKAALPNTRVIAASLITPIADFVRTYGPALWPNRHNLRSHLTLASVYADEAYWSTGDRRPGPYHDTHSNMTAGGLKTFMKEMPLLGTSAAGPFKREHILAYSQLGQLLWKFVSAMLHRSEVDKIYFEAIALDTQRLLHSILLADENPRPPPPANIDEVAHLAKMETYKQQTGGLGGLPVAHSRGAIDEERENGIYASR